MFNIHVMNMWVILLIIGQSFAASYNQPKLCSDAVWNATGVTFADNSTVGARPTGIFVNINNTVYVANQQLSQIRVWYQVISITATIYLSSITTITSLFVTNTGAIYIGDDTAVAIWNYSINSTLPLYTTSECFDIFIDGYGNLYCSLYYSNQVIKRTLNTSDYQITVIAGTSCSGYLNASLFGPWGIFVDTNYDLYVADSGNHRIQLFPLWQSVPTTVAGVGAPQTIVLNTPTDVVLDADGYLFIVDSAGQRIIGSGPSGFQCIIGCSGGGSSGSNQLNSPTAMAFDNYGNIYVADTSNNRIQLFFIVSNSCNTTNTSINIVATTITSSIVNTTSSSSVSDQQSVSYNQPKFCALASWNPNGITSGDPTVPISAPHHLFVNTNNTIYTVGSNGPRILMWSEGNVNQISMALGTISSSWSLFVTSSGDIYIDNVYVNGQVEKWSINGTSGSPVMPITQLCGGIFIDINNTLYCSQTYIHQIVATSLNGISDTPMIIAGTGCAGSTADALTDPFGIFVDINFNLYVADYSNNRIQQFQTGQPNATTLAGSSAPGTITLNQPTGVFLDGNGYLFIVDCYNHRIVGSGPTGFRCIVGCLGTYGSASNQLYYPFTMGFDSYGNIFVSDTFNNRIQQFVRAVNFCVVPYNQPTICSAASWNSTGTTFANRSTVGTPLGKVFVDATNAVYVSTKSSNLVQAWYGENAFPTKNISGQCRDICGLFVTVDGDIYINDDRNTLVIKWSLNSTNSTIVLNVGASCYGLFIDINNTLYCSINARHKVVAISLNNNNNPSNHTVIAGTGLPGPASTKLHSPQGIFVTTNFNLYVADCGNDRVQLFYYGQLNATTVAGNGFSAPITLNCPTDVVLDVNNYLFIADNNNHRIIGSGPYGFHCIIGCSGPHGPGSTQLNHPQSLSFDSFGNLFVVDMSNNRIQQFLLNDNSCSMYTGIPFINPTTTTAPLNQSSCLTPVVILIPSTTTFSSPLQFRRDQYFFLSSYVQLTCNSSLSMNTQWSIYNCTSNCTSSFQLGQTIVTTTNELFIPAKTLPYGTYQLKLTVSMVVATSLTFSASAYVKIIPSGITPNLVQYGTSMITSGRQQNLLLDPGTFSVDPDAAVFNASNWNYNYYCRIYGQYEFPNNLGVYLTIDDPAVDPLNPSCLSNRSGWAFGGKINSPKSSMTILANSLASNQIYQFMVYMQNRKNSSLQATGYLLVQVVDTQPQLIVIACVISTLCAPNLEYQYVNPTTQVALFSVCTGACTSINSITWTIYSGVMNSSSNIVQWTPYNQMNQYQNIWFFGTYTTNFTASNNLFLSNSSVEYWRFEVVYSFPSETTSSSLNFIINQPPQNGSCSISPLTGTTTTLFTVSCQDWEDQDGIQDYSIYSWTTDRSQSLLVAFSFFPNIGILLPPGDDVTSILNSVVYIRDTLGCITQFNLTFVVVLPDTVGINNFVNSLQTSTSAANADQIVRMLSGGNQNVIGQTVISLSQVFNQMNIQSINNTVSNGVPATSISISSLADEGSQLTYVPLNTSALIEYNKQLNSQAQIRDYLMPFMTNLIIATSSSIILQATSLVQLTTATNQLTRTATLLASNKCYQLAAALYSMANQISYEDVQSAAIQLSQCTSNVVSAINAPLQQRTSILDLDFSRANTLPQDYDTDLEYEWSNLNNFADGNDFSYETIQKNRNTYYQKQAANQIANEATQTMALVTAALNIQLNIKQNMTANMSLVWMSLGKTSLGSLSDQLFEPISNARFRFPPNFVSNAMENTTIALQSMMQPLAPLGQSPANADNNQSRSISVTILDQNLAEVLIQTNMTNPIELMIPRDPNMVIPSMYLQNVTSINGTLHNQLFYLYYIDITNLPSVSAHFEIHPMDTSLGYLFIYKFETSPILNSSINQIDGWTLFCPASLTNESIYTYYIDNQKTVGHQSIVFGIRELNSTELIYACSNTSIVNPPITDNRFNFTSDFEIRIYTSGCYYLDVNNNWQSDGLVVGPLTTPYATECYTTHLTTFASGFTLFPAPINWSYVFANADFVRNKTVYLTVICVSILYIILIIFARYKDKKDMEKLGVIPLPDNHRSDQYFYQIIVFTGHRKHSGTKSKVYCVLSGEEDTTRVRTFACSNRPILQRAGIDAFIMAVPKSLGFLHYTRIWHDNTGAGMSASWFLKYIIVRDLQTMEKFHFICQRWLAVEHDDGKIERILFAANELEKQEIFYVLSKGTYHKIAEDHLWFSVFSRPVANKFTRVQRCTCCFVFFFITMCLNITYYDLSSAAAATNNSTTGVSVGPFYISAQQIIIGVIVELFSLIPSILLVQLFRRLRPRQLLLPDQNSKMKKRSRLTFPWWFIFVAYGFCLIAVTISIVVIIARGVEFGDLKTQKWLTSIIASFISSIFLVQPIKVLSLVIFFACINRNDDDDREAGQHLEIENSDFSNSEAQEMYQPVFAHLQSTHFGRLNEEQLAFARQRRLKELRMWSILHEVSVYIGFLLILCIITYSNHDQNAFIQADHLRKFILNTRQIDNDFTKISTVSEYWSWLEESFVSNLRAQQWYNDDPPRNLSGFINDKSNRLIGWAIMRQLRYQSSPCPNQQISLYCLKPEQETRSFTPGWTNETTQVLNNSINQAFIYQTNGYVYEFRGRLDDLQSNLSELHQLSWIDNQTQAVIIQLNLYNPNSQLFSSITLLAEFLLTSGIESTSRFESFNFYSSFTSVFQLICWIIYIGFILYFLFNEIQSFFHLKFDYFQQIWSYIELGILICSWSSIALYICRYREANYIDGIFAQTNGYVYIDLQFYVYINNLLTYFLSFCCFLGTIKSIHLFRFVPRLLLFVETLKHAGKDLLGFTVMFSIIFMAFLSLFYLLFLSKMSRCSSLFNATQMLFEMMVTKFNTSELIRTAPFLGPFCFSIFMIFVVFICMNMFVSIINNSFRCVRAKVNHDEQIFSFIWTRFQRWTGLKLSRETHNTRYTDLMENFSIKFDRLLDALYRLHINQRSGRI